jgi:hypothetical protein
MYIEHPDFEQPKNESTKVWRYMDLSKFLSLLETSSLYFTRSDKFIDPYEGTIPKINSEKISTYFTEFDNAIEMQNELLNLFDFNRKLTLINCWYQSEYESDAMWQLYSNNGIAIQTTFGKLKNSFNDSDDKVLIGQVKYIDYNQEGMFYLNALTPFLFKRISFEHEKEIRAVIWNTHTNREPVDEDDKVAIEIIDHGKFSNIDIETLIETIYVSPTAPSWFHKLVISILNKYKLDKPVIHSQLYTIENVSTAGQNSTSNKITISKEVLEHFYKKDSYRINIETLKSEREKFREYENFISELKSLDTEIEKCNFTWKTKYHGKEALYQFSKTQFSKKEVENLFNKTQFKSLYFFTGKVDTLIRDIKNGNLSDKEKEILIRKAIYFYSENIFQPAILIVQQIEKYNIKEQPLQMFADFTRFMADLTIQKKV